MKLWAPLVQEVSALSGENRERMMALLWRESHCSFAPGYEPAGDPVGWGDRKYAFGPFQIDRRYHKDFIVKELGLYAYSEMFGPVYRPIRQAMYAADLLRNNREWLKQNTGMRGDPLERATYASYNAGPGRVYQAYKKSEPIDSVTTGKDYSTYIFNLAAVLQKPEYASLWS